MDEDIVKTSAMSREIAIAVIENGDSDEQTNRIKNCFDVNVNQLLNQIYDELITQYKNHEKNFEYIILHGKVDFEIYFEKDKK